MRAPRAEPRSVIFARSTSVMPRWCGSSRSSVDPVPDGSAPSSCTQIRSCRSRGAPSTRSPRKRSSPPSGPIRRSPGPLRPKRTRSELGPMRPALARRPCATSGLRRPDRQRTRAPIPSSVSSASACAFAGAARGSGPSRWIVNTCSTSSSRARWEIGSSSRSVPGAARPPASPFRDSHLTPADDGGSLDSSQNPSPHARTRLRRTDERHEWHLWILVLDPGAWARAGMNDPGERRGPAHCRTPGSGRFCY